MSEGGLPFREVYDSGGKLGALLFVCLVGLALGVWLTLSYLRSDFGFVLVGFSIVAAMLIWGFGLVARLTDLGKAVITVDTASIHDRRISLEPVRWSTVDLVMPVKTRYGTRGAFLVMKPEAIKALRMSAAMRLMQAIDSVISMSGALRVSAAGTQFGGEELYKLCLAYSASHKVQDEPANV